MPDSKEIPWLIDQADAWRSQIEQGRLPHAVLIQGAAGIGKRAAASWLAGRFLGISGTPPQPRHPCVHQEHADLRWISVPDDKRSIGIDQIRTLVAEIRLTSYEGAGKAAIVEPADAMTSNAANSLLKTLEEPPGASLLILIAERPSRLPATVLSRCQRVSIHTPPTRESLDWLDQWRPSSGWAAALRSAGGAPIAAIDMLERLPVLDEMAADFQALASGSAAPLEVAGRWSKHDPDFVLDWLAREVQQLVYGAGGDAGRGGRTLPAESVLRRIDRRNLFCYLDIINRLRHQNAGSYNVQLAFESLLIDWSEGLVACRDTTEMPLQGMG